MKILEKIRTRQENLYDSEIPVIAFTGDSVTQGCFECHTAGEHGLTTVFDEKSGYVRRTQEILSLLYPSVAIDFVNAGINGGDTAAGLSNLQRNVLSRNPDLVVVSYGLNDAVKGERGIEEYGKNLGAIFDEIQKSGGEIIFLTQNFMCTQIDSRLKDKLFIDLAENFSDIQNSGLLDRYFAKAKDECQKRNIKICDLRSRWKTMSEKGVDTTRLLSNKLNHPVRSLHYYMAVKLVETMFD